MDHLLLSLPNGQPWDKNKGIGDDSDVTCQGNRPYWKAPMGGKTGVSIRLDLLELIT